MLLSGGAFLLGSVFLSSVSQTSLPLFFFFALLFASFETFKHPLTNPPYFIFDVLFWGLGHCLCVGSLMAMGCVQALDGAPRAAPHMGKCR